MPVCHRLWLWTLGPLQRGTQVKDLTREEVNERIKGILEAAGVDCVIVGHIGVLFPDGARCIYLPLNIDARGHERFLRK